MFNCPHLRSLRASLGIQQDECAQAELGDSHLLDTPLCCSVYGQGESRLPHKMEVRWAFCAILGSVYKAQNLQVIRDLRPWLLQKQSVTVLRALQYSSQNLAGI